MCIRDIRCILAQLRHELRQVATERDEIASRGREMESRLGEMQSQLAEIAAELQAARGERDLSVIDLSAVLEASPAFVCALSPQGRVTGWNAAAASMTGYSRDAMVHQHLVEACVPEAAQQAVADHMEHVFALPPSDPLASEPGEAFP